MAAVHNRALCRPVEMVTTPQTIRSEAAKNSSNRPAPI